MPLHLDTLSSQWAAQQLDTTHQGAASKPRLSYAKIEYRSPATGACHFPCENDRRFFRLGRERRGTSHFPPGMVQWNQFSRAGPAGTLCPKDGGGRRRARPCPHLWTLCPASGRHGQKQISDKGGGQSSCSIIILNLLFHI